MTVLVHLDDGRVGGAGAAVEAALLPERATVVPKLKIAGICFIQPERDTKPFVAACFCRANRTVSVKREGKYLNKGGSFSCVSRQGFSWVWESGETRFLDVSPYSQLSIPINSQIDATRKATEGIELNGGGGFPRPSMSARS